MYRTTLIAAFFSAILQVTYTSSRWHSLPKTVCHEAAKSYLWFGRYWSRYLFRL